jgi:hypothetical protein
VAERGFCRDCGTPLTFRFGGDDLHVSLCSLDAPGLIAPSRQFDTESELSWCANLASLPRVRTEEDMSSEVSVGFVNYQHPDRDS